MWWGNEEAGSATKQRNKRSISNKGGGGRGGGGGGGVGRTLPPQAQKSEAGIFMPQAPKKRPRRGITAAALAS